MIKISVRFQSVIVAEASIHLQPRKSPRKPSKPSVTLMTKISIRFQSMIGRQASAYNPACAESKHPLATSMHCRFDRGKQPFTILELPWANIRLQSHKTVKVNLRLQPFRAVSQSHKTAKVNIRLQPFLVGASRAGKPPFTILRATTVNIRLQPVATESVREQGKPLNTAGKPPFTILQNMCEGLQPFITLRP